MTKIFKLALFGLLFAMVSCAESDKTTTEGEVQVDSTVTTAAPVVIEPAGDSTATN